MFLCYKKCLQVFSFAINHRCWHQNFSLKNMIMVLKEMLGWFWLFVWIFMLIPVSNNISLGFTYVNSLLKTDFLIDSTWRVWIFLFQSKKQSNFLYFPKNSKKSYFSLVKNFNFFNSCLDTFSFSFQNRTTFKTKGFDSK